MLLKMMANLEQECWKMNFNVFPITFILEFTAWDENEGCQTSASTVTSIGGSCNRTPLMSAHLRKLRCQIRLCQTPNISIILRPTESDRDLERDSNREQVLHWVSFTPDCRLHLGQKADENRFANTEIDK